VTFLGHRDKPEELFAVADVFVLPALYEPFGMVIAEAMAAGIPVVASRCCGAVEDMISGVHGIFLDDPTDDREIAAGLRTLIEDPRFASFVGSMGRTFVQRWLWPEIAAQHLACFEQLLDEG
jgi:glycosyltransferase involved in cell wall biosynthesis